MTFKAAHPRSYYERIACFRFRKDVPKAFLVRILEVNFGLYGTAYVAVQTDGILLRNGTRTPYSQTYSPNVLTLS